MARQIIKQPNGLFCIFSTIVDNIIYYNMSNTEIIELYCKESREEITKKVNDTISQLNECKKPYYQFTKNYNEMLETIESYHGKKESKKINLLINPPKI